MEQVDAEFILMGWHPVGSTHPLWVPLVTRASPSLSALSSGLDTLVISGLGQPGPGSGALQTPVGQAATGGGLAGWPGLAT